MNDIELENYINQNIDDEAEKEALLENLEKYRNQAKGETEEDFLETYDKYDAFRIKKPYRRKKYEIKSSEHSTHHNRPLFHHMVTL